MKPRFFRTPPDRSGNCWGTVFTSPSPQRRALTLFPPVRCNSYLSYLPPIAPWAPSWSHSMICKGPACTLLCVPPRLLVETCCWTSQFPRNPWQDGPLPNSGREATARFRALGCYQAHGAGPLQRSRARGHCKSERTWPLSSSKHVPLQRSRTGPMQCRHWATVQCRGVRREQWGVKKKDWGGQKKRLGGEKKRLGGQKKGTGG